MLRLHSSTFPGPCTISLAPLVPPWPSILSPGRLYCDNDTSLT
jgi:hypothetical protein